MNSEPRAPYQVLVVPYRLAPTLEVAVLLRSDDEAWQFVAGGGAVDEAPAAAARREAQEELGMAGLAIPEALQSRCTIPRVRFLDAGWDDTVLVVDEFAFAVDCEHREISLSDEHRHFLWCAPEVAMPMLRWDSNRTALWEFCWRRGVSVPLP